MRLPLSDLFDGFLSSLNIHTKTDKQILIGKELGYVITSLLAVGSLPLAALSAGAIALSTAFRQPSSSRLEDILHHFKIPNNFLQKKIDWKAAGLTTAFFGAAFFPNYDFFYGNIVDMIQRPEFISTKRVGFEAIQWGLLYEIGCSTYQAFRRIKPLSTLMFSPSYYRDSFLPYLSSKKHTSPIGKITQMNHLLKKHPTRGLAKLLTLHFDEGVTDLAKIHGMPEEYVLHLIGKNAASAVVNFLAGYHLDKKYEQPIFELAAQEAFEKEDLSMLPLLGLHETTTTGSTELFKKQIPLILKDSKLKNKVIGEGASTQTIVRHYGEVNETLSSSLVHKLSGDYQDLLERKIMTEYLYTLHPGNVSKIVDLSHYANQYMLTELRLRVPFLYEVVRYHPELLQDAYMLSVQFQDSLHEGNFPFIQRIDFEKKHLKKAKINTKEFRSFLRRHTRNANDAHIIVPVTDGHPYNLGQHATFQQNIDIQNKGSTSPMYDFVNVFDFAHGLLTYQEIKAQKKKAFPHIQQRLNLDTPQLEESYLDFLVSRTLSYDEARDDRESVVKRIESQRMISHTAQVLEDYVQESTQRKIAQDGLILMNDLKKVA